MKIAKMLLIIIVLLVIPTTISINSEKDLWPEESTEKVNFKENPIKYYIKNYKECVLKDVEVTAYTSHSDQTDDSPFIAAWNNRLHPVNDKYRAIAISRDLLKDGLDYGDLVLVVKDNGDTIKCTVKDKMNKRFKNRIDLYFGIDRDEALDFGIKNWKIIYKKS